MKLIWSLACLLLAVGCAHGALSPSSANAGRWLEVVTPNFVLSTNQLEPIALDTARALEESRASLLQLAWTGARNPPRGRVDVVVFRSPNEFNRYAGLGHTAAGVAFHREGERRLLSFHPGPGNGIPSIVVHELAHDLSEWFMPIQPPWFSEGFATYLETISYDRSTQQAVLGQPARDHVGWLQQTGVVLRSEKLFATSRRLHDDSRETMSFYASSWLLIHYLLNREGERFGEFQRRLAHLEEWHHAWQTTFGDLPAQQLDAQLIAHWKQTKAFSLSGPVRLEAFEPRLRALTEAEKHGTLALVASIHQPELARREALAARRLDPNELNALRAQFRALDAADDRTRRELAQLAVAAHPERAEAWWLLAQASSGSETERALEQAHRLEPEHPGVARSMAQRRLQRGDARAALPLTQLALRRSEASSSTLIPHLQALVGVRNCTDALLLQGTLERWLADHCAGEKAASCGELERTALRQLVGVCTGADPAAVAVAGTTAKLWTLPWERLLSVASATARSALDEPRTCIEPTSRAASSDTPRVPGRLAPEVIRSVVRANYSLALACYERGLARYPILEGRVTVRFVIERDGRVSQAYVVDNDVPDCGVARCIREMFSQLQFPKPEGGLVTVRYPIVLQPSEP